MNEELYTTALKTALNEIESKCPDVNQSFILTSGGTLILGDQKTLDPSVQKTMSFLKDLTGQTDGIGSLEELSVEGENGKVVYVSRISDFYYSTSMSDETNLPKIRTLTGVIFPTIIKAIDSIPPEATPSPVKVNPPHSSPSKLGQTQETQSSEPEEETVEEIAQEPTEAVEQPQTQHDQESPGLEMRAEQPEAETAPKRQMTNVPSQQFIIDKLGGFMVRSDTVQMDSEILQRWKEILNGQEITEVDIETFGETTARCKIKVINDKKLEGRGLVRLPEKLCRSLELKKGELVRVKPVIISEGE